MAENHIFPLQPKFIPIWKSIQEPRILAGLLHLLLPESQEAPLTEGNIVSNSLKVIPETRGHFPLVEFTVWRGEEEIIECEIILCTTEEENYPLLEEATGHLVEQRKHRDANCFSKRSESIKKTMHIWIEIDTAEPELKRFGSGSFAGFLLRVPSDAGSVAQAEGCERALRLLRRFVSDET